MKKFKGIYMLLLIVAIVPFVSSCGYNTMVSMDEGVKSQWAQVQNAYQRRADLIPNLVNTVQGYAKYEQGTLTAVVEARAKATSVNVDASKLNAASIKQFQEAQGGLSSALSKLLVVVEKYPDLKANQNFLDLQAQLEGTENRIAVERQKFNDATKDYNSYIRKFPQIMFSGWFGFQKKDYFEADKGAQKAPEVKF